MKSILKIFFCLSILYITSSSLFSRCSRNIYKGDIRNASFSSTKSSFHIPKGMVIIPTTLLNQRGYLNHESVFGERGVTKRVTVAECLMDATLITNGEYFLYIQKICDDSGIDVQKVINKNNQENENEDSTIVERGEVEGEEGEGENEEEEEELQIEGAVKFTLEEIKERVPDSGVWKRDFPHHVDETFEKHYFTHDAFKDFPVVGVSWTKARYFSAWRTRFANRYRSEEGLPPLPEFRLPRSIELEAAQRGGIPNAKYPWGGPSARDTKGRIMANCKTKEGDYAEPGMAYTTPVKYFKPNNYGIYDAVGNVWQLTEDAYYDKSDVIVATGDLNSVYVNENEPRKIAIGGAFNTYLRKCGEFTVIDKDKSYADTGFRCAMNSFRPVNFSVKNR